MSANRILDEMGIRNIVLTVLGFVMVLCPLALWVAWTETIFYGILLTFGITFCAICLIDNTRSPGDSH
jgi:hypothetical protein